MSKDNHVKAMKYLSNSGVMERNLQFRQSIVDLDYKFIISDNIPILENIYSKLKELGFRKKLLQSLYHNSAWNIKDFFLKAYKKERYLDLKLDAIRGYSLYASEEEVDKLMNNFMQLLIKRPESTPYNYQEYECLRAACGFPFLISQYGYSCFINVFNQVEKQYNDMPNEFKGHFTLDKDGNIVQLKTPEESKNLLDSFFNKK